MDKMIDFSNEILKQVRETLSAEFIYLSYPLGLLNCQIVEQEAKVKTNGKVVGIDCKKSIEITAKEGVKGVSVWLLHTLMHHLFLHPFKKVEDKPRYDLASDLTVSYALDSLGYVCGERRDKESRKAVYKSIIDSFGGVNDQTCEQFCKGLNTEEVKSLYPLFEVCSHEDWLGREDRDEEKSEDGINFSFGGIEEEEAEALNDLWGGVSRNLLPQIGKLNPELKRMISLKLGVGGNYKSFLKNFLRRRERIRPSDEEFDYIYYLLGLINYGNVPLIENLEYSDRRDYSDIAIAVDTSGSTDGEPIKRLLKEVFSLIKSMETESKKYRVRIIQCDLKIQREDVVHSTEELAQLLSNYVLEGGGGTDFCPVFEYLSNLKKKGEKIEGLIYFTDGVGLYPRQVPPFKTCFAILGENEGVRVPHFAYRINIED